MNLRLSASDASQLLDLLKREQHRFEQDMFGGGKTWDAQKKFVNAMLKKHFGVER